MEIIRVKVQGPCSGVLAAQIKAKQVAAKHPGEKVYCLGFIVHNKFAVEDMAKVGIITLDDQIKTREQWIDELEPGSVVIFSSHGTAKYIFDKARVKGLVVYDTTCRYVYKTHEIVQEHLNAGNEVVFIGKLDHPETISVMALSPKIHLITNIKQIANLNIKSAKIAVTNQTTLSTIDLQEIFNELQKKYPSIIIEDEICYATRERQEAVKELKDQNIDLLLVIGDPRSNNSNKLAEVGNAIGIKSKMIETLNDIDKSWFEGCKRVAVTSGASTPKFLVDETIAYLEKLFSN